VGCCRDYFCMHISLLSGGLCPDTKIEFGILTDELLSIRTSSRIVSAQMCW
jgi:hypothetical protein